MAEPLPTRAETAAGHPAGGDFHQAGVKRLITNNERDFRGFGCFEIVTFA
jgi:hypothetical protein